MTDLHCPNCGYNLRGNTSGQCPECGERATPQEVLDQLARLRQTWERSYRLCVRVVALQSFAFIVFSLFSFHRVPWIILMSPAVLFVATTAVVAIRLGYDRGRYIAVERSVRHGRPAGPHVLFLSLLFASVSMVGFQLVFLTFGVFLMVVR